MTTAAERALPATGRPLPRRVRNPETTSLAACLRETASYAMSPSFKEELREALLRQLRAYWRGTGREVSFTRRIA